MSKVSANFLNMFLYFDAWIFKTAVSTGFPKNGAYSFAYAAGLDTVKLTFLRKSKSSALGYSAFPRLLCINPKTVL